MKKILLETGLLLTSLAALSGCMGYEDAGEKSLDYDRLNVSFSATLPIGYVLSDAMCFGAYGTCTRDGVENTVMSSAGVSRMEHTSSSPWYFFSKTDEDAIVGVKGDHGYRFYAYYPYSESCSDMAAIPVEIPSRISWSKDAQALAPLLVASSSVTSVIAPVPMTFSAPATCMLTLRIPDTACEVLKSLMIHPANEKSWKGSLAFNGTYNIFDGTITEDESTVSKSITIDFGAQGHRMEPGYLNVTFLMAEAKYLTGGVELVLTDIDGNVTKKQIYNARQAFEAGSSYTYTMK